MGVFDSLKKYFETGPKQGVYAKKKPLPQSSDPTVIESHLLTRQGGTMTPILVEPYDGEKNVDNIGPIKDYLLDHQALAARSRQAYIESEIAKTIVDRFINWVIGDGLKIQVEPLTQILQNEGIDLEISEFSKQVEPYFELFASSYQSDWSKEQNFHQIANLAAKTAFISGDCLLIGRLKDDRLSFQIIDGQWLKNPPGLTNQSKLKNNNTLDNGVEVNAKGQHIAYHVQQKDGFTTKRIEAFGRETGMRFAWLVPGIKYRASDNRGIPILASTLETLKKLERYKEATVSTAEEAAKLSYQITHEAGTTPENPMIGGLANSFDADGDVNKESYEGKNLENTVYASTDRKAVNLPPGTEIKPMQHSNGEINFKDFYHPNIQLISSAAGIPYEVMLMMYNSNFSASRAALKDWENTKDIWTQHFADHTYQPAYNLFFTMKVVQNKIQAPGYLRAFMEKNTDVVESYRKARFIGKGVPHIDPVKEIKALREMLGNNAKHLPLTTLKKAVERMNSGDSDVNLEKFAQELEKAEGLGLNNQNGETTEPEQDRNQDGGDENNEQ